jgi:hypothetical protein
MTQEVELFPGYVAKLGLGTLPHEDIDRYTGLEMLQRLIDQQYPAPPINAVINFALTEVSEGRAVFRGGPQYEPSKPAGSGAWGVGGDADGFGARLRSAHDARQRRRLFNC